jgi:hypothetical protein
VEHSKKNDKALQEFLRNEKSGLRKLIVKIMKFPPQAQKIRIF